jgi:hypothetical protein
MKLNVSSNLFILALAVLGSAKAEDYTGDTNACDGVTCSNKGFCVPSDLYNKGYWCECDDGWVGQNCGHPQPTVVCGDSEISITIDTGIVEELNLSTEQKFVYFGNSDQSGTTEELCSARLENDKFKLKLAAPFNGCGTTVINQNGDDYTFSNTVVWNSEVNNTNINRELVLLDFKCIYADEYTVLVDPDSQPTIDTLKVETSRGLFSVSMSIYEDNTFAPDKEYTSSPSIGIGTYVYAQVALDDVSDPNLVVTMEDCYATQTRDPGDMTTAKHFLIKSRCSDSDPTVDVYSNGETHKSRFKFQMFKWRWSGDPIFLHCEVDICNKTSETCVGKGEHCSGQGLERKRRDLEYQGEFIHDDSYARPRERVLTMGPLMVAANDVLISESPSRLEEVDVTMVYLGLSLGVVLAVLGAIVGAMLRKRRQISSKQAEEEASNSLTALRFTREAF